MEPAALYAKAAKSVQPEHAPFPAKQDSQNATKPASIQSSAAPTVVLVEQHAKAVKSARQEPAPYRAKQVLRNAVTLV